MFETASENHTTASQKLSLFSRYEGTSSIESSFSMLGQIAVGGLMKDPAVQKQLGRLTDAIDTGKVDEVFKEAGLSTDSGASAKAK